MIFCELLFQRCLFVNFFLIIGHFYYFGDFIFIILGILTDLLDFEPIPLNKQKTSPTGFLPETSLLFFTVFSIVFNEMIKLEDKLIRRIHIFCANKVQTLPKNMTTL